MSNGEVLTKEASLSHIIRTVGPAVVSISGTSMDESGATSRTGTGIIVRSDGFVLTSKHLVGP